MRPHSWIHLGLLDEPGISDIEHGRYQRAAIECEYCDEKRKVWKFTDFSSDALLYTRLGSLEWGCPASRWTRLRRDWRKRQGMMV